MADEPFDYIGTLRLLTETDATDLPSNVAQLYIDRAKALVLNRRNPFSADAMAEPWESRYDMLACEMAAAMWWKHGADGQTASRENGIYRAWDHLDAYVPSGLLQRVVPIAAVL